VYEYKRSNFEMTRVYKTVDVCRQYKAIRMSTLVLFLLVLKLC